MEEKGRQAGGREARRGFLKLPMLLFTEESEDLAYESIVLRIRFPLRN
jgi:hypothetical protein